VRIDSHPPLVRPRKLKRHMVSGFYHSGPPTNARTTACKMCHGNSGVIELLVDAPTVRCKHFAEVCLNCINRVILKAFKSSQPILCPSRNCSERLSHIDVQRWLTPPGLDRYVAFIALAMGKSHIALCIETMRGRGHFNLYCEQTVATCILWNKDAQLETHRQIEVRHLRIVSMSLNLHTRPTLVAHDGLTSGRWEEHQRNLPQQQEPVRHESFQRGGRACSGPDYGRQVHNLFYLHETYTKHVSQIQNVEGYRPRL
jgi:hypothetical protein